MKVIKLFAFLIASCYCIVLNAQIEETPDASFQPLGVSVSTGVNNAVGMIGVGIYYAIKPNFIVEAGVGQGSWGAIGAFQMQYYLPHAEGIYFRGAFKRSGGGRDIELELELIDKSIQKVMFNFYPTVNLQLTAGHSWTIKNMHRFFIEGGYSYFAGIQENTYRILDKNNQLSMNGKTVLHTIIPGGLVLALGFAIGF